MSETTVSTAILDRLNQPAGWIASDPPTPPPQPGEVPDPDDPVPVEEPPLPIPVPPDIPPEPLRAH
jgi:hypothetical protein